MKAKVLIIDDDPELRGILRQRFVLEGYEVCVAADGREGLARYEECGPDVVITDLLMPEIDGLEVIRNLKSKAHPPLVIAMSGGGSRGWDFLIEASEFGAIRTLSKPFILDHLVSLTNELCAKPLLP